MNDHEMRELLQEIIDDVDSGRVEVERPLGFRRARTLLTTAAAAALGVGLAACSGSGAQKTRAAEDAKPVVTRVDATTPKRPPPAPPMKNMTPPAAPPRLDAGPQPEYAAPAPPPAMRAKPRKRRPMRVRRPKLLYGVPD